jgi:hypothetical protein
MMLRGVENEQHRMVELPVSNELGSRYNKVATVYYETLSYKLPWKTEEDTDKHMMYIGPCIVVKVGGNLPPTRPKKQTFHVVSSRI